MSLTPGRKPPPGQRRYRQRPAPFSQIRTDAGAFLLLMSAVLTCFTPKALWGLRRETFPQRHVQRPRVPGTSQAARGQPSSPHVSQYTQVKPSWNFKTGPVSDGCPPGLYRLYWTSCDKYTGVNGTGRINSLVKVGQTAKSSNPGRIP